MGRPGTPDSSVTEWKDIENCWGKEQGEMKLEAKAKPQSAFKLLQ